MTAEEICEIFAKTLTGDYEDDAAWDAVRELHRIGSREVFNRAADWCKSDNPLVRARGIDVLSQLGKTADHPNNSFPEESYSLVSDLLKQERDVQPLASAIAALGHLDNPLAIPLITEHRAHPSAEIRFHVACALGSFPNDPRTTSTQLVLTDDTDEDVRDWATFGLGVLGDLDSIEIRDALFQRLGDPNEDVREEAMVGLGKRRDHRVLPALKAALRRASVSDRVIEAAYEMLNMRDACKDWGIDEYVTALSDRFGC